MAQSTLPEPRSEGHRQLQELSRTHSLSEIGSRCGVSKQTVHRWVRGEKTPPADSRKALEDAFGLPSQAWDLAPGSDIPEPSEPPSSPVPPPSASVTPFVTSPSDVPEPSTALECLRRHVRECTSRRARAESENAGSLVLKDLVALERQAIVAWGRATGEMSPGDEARLTTSSRYLRIQGAIIQALAPYPDASHAVLRALAEVEPEAARAIELQQAS